MLTPVHRCWPQDDLICLPPRLAERLGNLGPLVLCTRVASAVTLLDPTTLRHAQVEVCFSSEPQLHFKSSRVLCTCGAADRQAVSEALHDGGYVGLQPVVYLCV